MTDPIYTDAQLHAMGRYTDTAEAGAEAYGRAVFVEGHGLGPAKEFASNHTLHSAESVGRGWWDAHRVRYAEGVLAADNYGAACELVQGMGDTPEPPDNPYPQFSPSWEAWVDGFEATMAREA